MSASAAKTHYLAPSQQAQMLPPERFPEQFDPAKHVYGDYLRASPEWRQAIFCNRGALIRCDLVVLLLPCGNDSHADWAFAVGWGLAPLYVASPMRETARRRIYGPMPSLKMKTP